jgi:hypothetical protein
VKAGLARIAIRPVGDSPAQFGARIAADDAVLGKVAKSTGVRAE